MEYEDLHREPIEMDTDLDISDPMPEVEGMEFNVEISLCTRHINMCFVHILGCGKHIFKDLVCLIVHFYSRSEYDKPFEC